MNVEIILCEIAIIICISGLCCVNVIFRVHYCNAMYVRDMINIQY